MEDQGPQGSGNCEESVPSKPFLRQQSSPSPEADCYNPSDRSRETPELGDNLGLYLGQSFQSPHGIVSAHCVSLPPSLRSLIWVQPLPEVTRGLPIKAKFQSGRTLSTVNSTDIQSHYPVSLLAADSQLIIRAEGEGDIS